MEQVYDSIGVGEERIFRKRSSRNADGFFADFPSEVLRIHEIAGKNELGNEKMEKFLFNFGI